MSSDTNEVAAFEQLGRLTLLDQSMDTFLQRVCDLAVEVLPGDLESSISLVKGKAAWTSAYTGQLALDCDERQYASGDGPCLHAATTGELTEIADMQTESRWPNYVQRAAESGALSSLSVPLPIAEGVAGALNVYARTAHAFDEESRALAGRFGPCAAVAVANMHAYEDARKMAGHLRAALESRAVIDQAKGILMERYKVTADQAFHLLTRSSMHSNQKLRVVADELVRTGRLPNMPTLES
ncbi:MAG: Response regulator with antiterminator output domain [Blastococcus sp.]|jgi:GAF domain-containing protein|nr:Response regulator with antiterminator output domain [Blastococcus sp.]